MNPRLRRVAAGPIAINLAAAAVLRAVVPLTLADSGERYRYYGMSLVFPEPGCPAFHCFRVLPPLLTSLLSTTLSIEIADAFIATGLLFHVLAATALWYLALEIHQSRRVAWWTVAWYWATWGAIQSLSDPLLITDPVQAFWSFASLYLLMRQRYATALLMLLTGASVKESVLLVPMIYAAYLFLARDSARRRVAWLTVLIAAPMVVWGALRYWLHTRYGYDVAGDPTYLRHTYLFGVWLPNLAPWPANMGFAALYIFGAFGPAWILALVGLRRGGRAQRALTIASLPAMVFLMIYQVPDRALASFPYAILMPAAVFSAGIPSVVSAFVIGTTAAFTIRMNAAPDWLPRIPVLLLLATIATAIAIWTGLRRRSVAALWEHDRSTEPNRPATVAWLACLALAATAAISFAVATRGLRHGPVVGLSLPSEVARIVDDEGGTPGLAVSPDGSRVVFVGKHPPDATELWLRPIASLVAQPLPETSGASAPFWSPDSRRLAFFTGGRLKTIDLETRRVVDLADAPQPRGGAWSRRDVIIFAPLPNGGLYQVSGGGGLVSPATPPDEPGRSWSHRWPSFLPDQDRFLFVKWHGSEEGLYVGSLSSARTILISGDAHSATYADKLLLFARENVLFAQPFDLRRVQMLGRPLHLGRAEMSDTGRSAFAMGADTLAIATDTAAGNLASSSRQLVWFDRSGSALSPVGTGELANGVDLSPDERFAVLSVGATGIDVPLWDLRRLRGTRGSFSAPAGRGPLWSPDLRWVAFARPTGDEEHRRWEIVRRATSGGPEQRLAANLAIGATARSWSPDGRVLLYHVRNPEAGWDIWSLANQENAQSTLLVHGAEHAVEPQFSPDGKWIAYVSDEAGRLQVYVQPYPFTGQRFMVTIEGGDQPRWRSDGKELFYVARHRYLMAMDVEATPTFRTGPPHLLFEVKLPLDTGAFLHEYAVTADGRFLVNTSTAPEPSAHVAIVLNWKGVLTSPQ